MEALKKIIENKAVQIGLGIIGLGIVLSNFWTIIWWAVLGGAAVVLFVAIESYLIALKENKK